MTKIATEALQLWAIQLVPSLLPYMIIASFTTKLLYRYLSIFPCVIHKFCYRIFHLSVYGTFILFAGQLCGYPVGAKLVSDGYKNKILTLNESNYLLTICNQSSPGFLIYYVGKYILSERFPTSAICILFLLSTFITSFFTRHIYKNKITTFVFFNHKTDHNSPFLIFDNCIKESCFTMIIIVGYIIIFSIISAILLNIIHPQNIILKNLIYTLEITQGLSQLKKDETFHLSYVISVFTLTGFGGFSTLAQIKGMLLGTSLSIKPYLIGKSIYVIILISLTILFSYIKVISFNF